MSPLRLSLLIGLLLNAVVAVTIGSNAEALFPGRFLEFVDNNAFHYGRSPNFFLGKIKSDLNLWKKRGNGEPSEESNEKRPTRAVGGSHMWAGEVAELNLHSLVILIWIDFNGIGLVLSHLLKLFDEGESRQGVSKRYSGSFRGRRHTFCVVQHRWIVSVFVRHSSAWYSWKPSTASSSIIALCYDARQSSCEASVLKNDCC